MLLLLLLSRFSHVRLCATPIDGSPPGILQARILEWVTFPSPGDLPNPEFKPRSPTLQVDSLPAEPQNDLFDLLQKNMEMGDVNGSVDETG